MFCAAEIFTSLAAAREMSEAAETFDPTMFTSLPELREIFPAEEISETRFVVESVMRLPPLFYCPRDERIRSWID